MRFQIWGESGVADRNDWCEKAEQDAIPVSCRFPLVGNDSGILPRLRVQSDRLITNPFTKWVKDGPARLASFSRSWQREEWWKYGLRLSDK